MNCKDAQQAMMEGEGEPAAAVRAHVEACADCREFAQLWAALLAADLTPTPAPALDRLVLTAAHRRLRPPRWRLFRSPRLLALAAAAAIVVAAVIAGLALLASPPAAPPVARLNGAPHENAPTWAAAQEELAAIEGGLDAMVAELDLASPALDIEGSAAPGGEWWDSLMELEFDVYFESQNLPQTDG